MGKIKHTFIPTPTIYLYIFDEALLKMMLYLTNLDRFAKSKGYCDDGYFQISMEKMVKDLGKSENTIRLRLQTLWQSEFIFIKSEGKSGIKKCNRYKLNWDLINALDEKTMEIIGFMKTMDRTDWECEYFVKCLPKGSKITYYK